MTIKFKGHIRNKDVGDYANLGAIEARQARI